MEDSVQERHPKHCNGLINEQNVYRDRNIFRLRKQIFGFQARKTLNLGVEIGRRHGLEQQQRNHRHLYTVIILKRSLNFGRWLQILRSNRCQQLTKGGG